VLDQKASLDVWKGNLQGRDRIFLTHAGLILDGDNLRLTATNPADLNVAICPAPSDLRSRGISLEAATDGVFRQYFPPTPPTVNYKAEVEQVQAAGPAREIPLGKIEQPVAAAPLDSDFEKAAIWRIKFPSNIDLGTDPIIRFDYAGDDARVMLDGRFITDDFYNGRKFDLGLRRHAPDIFNGDLRIAILPLRKDAPIYMADSARPDFGSASSVVALKGVEIVPRYQVQLTAPSAVVSPDKITER
jgi:hypothetical protein